MLMVVAVVHRMVGRQGGGGLFCFDIFLCHLTR
jgi:hypothetical protein